MAVGIPFTLFSSDSTVKYANDILSVIALPVDSTYQFRYETTYIQQKVRGRFYGDCSGTKALIAFRSKRDCDKSERFIVPVRWAEIISVKYVADFYIITFRVGSYPCFSTDYDQAYSNFADIQACASDYFETSQEHNDSAVIEGVIPFADSNTIEDNNKNWRKIVRALSLFPDFNNNYFLKCSCLHTQPDKVCKIINDRVLVKEKKYYFMEIEYYQMNYTANKNCKIKTITDTNIIQHASGFEIELESRYDLVRLGFQTGNIPQNTVSEIQIRTYDNEESKYQTKVIIPIKVVKNKVIKFFISLAISIGAFFIGIPGIVNDAMSLEAKIAFSLSGAIIMIISNFYTLKD